MTEVAEGFKKTAAWIAAHRLDLRKEAGIQVAELIAEALQAEACRGAYALAAKDAEIERLREALKPFADVAQHILAEAPPEATMWQAFASCDGSVAQISLEYLRRARAALNPEASNV